MTHPKEIIKLHSVNYRVKNGSEELTILQDINLLINAGDSIAITGASGSGKTSLLNIMAGLEKPTSGQVFYEEVDITPLNEDQRAQLRAKKIGFVFQSFQLLTHLTAVENVMLPMEINHYPDAYDQAMNWLRQVGLSLRANHYPGQLSGGEQQRIAIARAFAIMPSVLFADEPTGNLDKKSGQTIIDLLFALNDQHKSTLIIVTHDDNLAKHCQTHWPLADGRLQC